MYVKTTWSSNLCWIWLFVAFVQVLLYLIKLSYFIEDDVDSKILEAISRSIQFLGHRIVPLERSEIAVWA